MNGPPPYQAPPPQPYPPASGYGPSPGQPPPPPKKSGGSGKGCLIALAIVGGIVVLIGATGAFFAYRFASSPDGKKIVSAVASGAALMSEAASAPGTKELRALGCKTALIFDAAKFEAITNSLGDGGGVKLEPNAEIVVTCATSWGAAAPTCDQVATTYVGAVGRAAGPFVVTVGASGQNPNCQAEFTATGERIPEPPTAAPR